MFKDFLQQGQQILHHLWSFTRNHLAPERLQRFRTVLFQFYVLMALLMLAFLALLAHIDPVFPPDVALSQGLQSGLPSFLASWMILISWPGYTLPWIAVQGLTLLILMAAQLRLEAFATLAATLGAGLTSNLMKIIIRRPRPGTDLVQVFQQLDSFSFPSGHVTLYTAFFGFLLFLCFTLLKRSWQRTVLSLSFLAMIALIGLSRMYLGEHWATDVLGGYLSGSLVLILVIQFYRRKKNQRFQSPSS